MTEDLQARQIELELTMRSLGVERYRSMLAKATARGEPSRTDAGQAFIKRIISPTTKAIVEFRAAAASGKAGRRHTAVKRLENIDADVIAFIASKVILDGVAASSSLFSLELAIGRALEDEGRFSAFVKQAPGLWRELQEDLKKRSKNISHRRTVLVHAFNRNKLEWDEWGTSDRIHVGAKIIELFIEATGLFSIEHTRNARGGKTPRLAVSAEVTAWLEKFHAHHEALFPVFLPMLVPPRDWTTPFDGGYLTSAVRPLRLVKSRNLAYLEELSNIAMPAVYQAVNALQRTAWKVNVNVLATMREMWESNIGAGAVLPSRDPLEIPAKPVDIDTNEEARRDWRRRAAKVYGLNTKSFSRRMGLMQLLSVADRFSGEKAIYFPYQLDFRGRVYATVPSLQPQGEDKAKALLTFAEGKPIKDHVALGWLMIHGANTYGFDKASLGERIDWTAQHEDDILASAADPIANRFWWDADQPWMFLAFCFEYAAFKREGFGFVSSLPVSLDGSCNGLQHYSAMLRDEVGGSAVNLTPSKVPQDIYQRVADVVTEKLKFDVAAGGENKELASLWLAFGIDRKTTKRQVMVLPYGGTAFSMVNYTEQHLLERFEAGEADPFGALRFKAVRYMAGLIWDSIGEVVIAARVAMDWLQKVARLAAAEGLPINWTAPTGFLVQQAYKNVASRRIDTRIMGRLLRLRVYEETDQIDRRRQAAGIAPNFVHSMDAAALCFSVCYAAEHNITSFAAVHDSFGTVAADVEMLGRCLRAAFVDQYAADVLAKFKDEVTPMLPPKAARKVPALPPAGSLDLSAVLESDFFFA